VTTDIVNRDTDLDHVATRGSPPARRGSDYAVLSRAVRKTGLLKRRPGYYSVKIGTNLLLLAAGWTAFALIGSSWWQLLVAAFLGVMFTQTAFIGHDAGHHQIAASKRVNALLGRLHGNLLIGLSYRWWISKHNRHHAHPNQVDRDPDIANGAIAFTQDHARARRGPRAWLTRHQAWLFFPMLLLEGFNLHVAAIQSLLGRTDTPRATRLAEAGLLAVHLGGYLTALFWVLTPAQAVCFLLVQQALFGLYMGCSFAPNHKGMPVFAKDDKTDFLRRQVLTSRNIRGRRLTDFALGGLNYQIEHHLFPSMPRPNLRRAQGLVRAFCAQHGIAYHETGLLRSYAQVLRHLHAVGGPLRPELEY
jgi:fatty acid desaturase